MLMFMVEGFFKFNGVVVWWYKNKVIYKKWIIIIFRG